MQKCKVYKDGSHYIAIRPTTGYTGIRRKPPPEEPIVVEEPTEGLDEPTGATVAVEQPLQVEQITGQEEQNENAAPMSEEKPKIKRRVSTRADEFLRLYRESIGMKREQQYKYIASGLAPYFVSKEALHKYLERKMENKRRAEVTRRIRCLRRASLHELSYFATVTYFYGHCFQGGKNFAPLPALLRFMVSKGAFTIIFTPNSVNLREVRVQGF